MESNGCPGRVLISESPHTLLKEKYNNEFNFEENKKIEIATWKENIMSYYVNEKEYDE